MVTNFIIDLRKVQFELFVNLNFHYRPNNFFSGTLNNIWYIPFLYTLHNTSVGLHVYLSSR